MAHCREGALGFNQAQCQGCGHREWYASSCGDRHCPACLGPRQAQWSEQVCGRLPDCPHFHVVFTVPEEFHDFFEGNYRIAAGALFGAAAETLKCFQKNNWEMEGGFFGVLHTWGSALNWHPHLHVLVSGGGVCRRTGRWKQARPDYLFAVRALSKVFRAIMLRRVEALDGEASIRWPAGLESVEARRDWRVKLATRNWNIFSKPTLGNTRAVVRYLARYTSRIAMSNARISQVDEERRRVRFRWKNYREGGRREEREMPAKNFVRAFVRHLVPKGLRRIRYYGWLAGGRGGVGSLPGAPTRLLGERATPKSPPPCATCGANHWRYRVFFQTFNTLDTETRMKQPGNDTTRCRSSLEGFSLVPARADP